MRRLVTATAVLALLSGAAFAKPARKAVSNRMLQQDTTTVYDVSKTDRMGTEQYGMVERTRTTPKGGRQVISQMEYSDYTPSKMALANEKHAEVSVAVGGTYSFNKDSYDARYSNMGVSGAAQVMWDIVPHFALGADYMYLHPSGKTDNNREKYNKYQKFGMQTISLAGKWTLNAWDTVNVYIPLGVGMGNARIKYYGDRSGSIAGQSNDKWGLDLFAGLGMQYNFCADWFLGLEYRYVYGFIKDSKLSDYGRDKNLQFHNVFLRLGTRF